MSFPTYRFRLVREARTTAGNYNISTQGLRRLILIAPPEDLQDNFLKLVDDVESKVNQMKMYQIETDNLFNSLVQRAFRGEL